MRTLVVSDLHLGARERVDLLRRPELRAPLLERAAECDRVVLLGDALELRQAPLHAVLEAARPFFAELGAALGPDREVVLLAGNHDHPLIAPWLERRRRDGTPPPLGVAETPDHRPGEPLARLARWTRPATLTFAYPGVWLRDDVYATHGHYLDVHTTIPLLERLGIGLMGRVVGRPHAEVHGVDDHEAVLAPLFAWIHAVAQVATDERHSTAHGMSVKAWRALAGRRGRRRAATALLTAAFPVAVRALNRAGLGPLTTNVTGTGLRRASLRAMTQSLERTGVRAAHVLFGHTHRSGPWPRDEAAEWVTPGGTRLWNTGCWVYEDQFLTARPGESPYWPGVAAIVEDEGVPRLERLLGERGHAALAPPGSVPGLPG